MEYLSNELIAFMMRVHWMAMEGKAASFLFDTAEKGCGDDFEHARELVEHGFIRMSCRSDGSGVLRFRPKWRRFFDGVQEWEAADGGLVCREDCGTVIEVDGKKIVEAVRSCTVPEPSKAGSGRDADLHRDVRTLALCVALVPLAVALVALARFLILG